MKRFQSYFLWYCLILLTMQTALAQDWANLQRFQNENAQLPPPQANEKRVVFMGDSITEGWLNDPNSFFSTQPHYINRGIGGQTTPQMLLRFRADVIQLQPKVVVILAGINDIAGNTGPTTLEQIAGNIQSMAELAQAHHIKVVLASVLPAYSIPWRDELPAAEKVMALNQQLKAYAKANDCLYLDYFSAMVNAENGLKAALTYDGLHPNTAGYRVMQPLAEAALQQALAKE
ncbi:MAG: SGNH/GDSL hydrolase family protein [Flavobacteriaceae bacterium]